MFFYKKLNKLFGFLSIFCFILLMLTEIAYASAGVTVDVQNLCYSPVTFTLSDIKTSAVESTLNIPSSEKKELSYVKDKKVIINALSNNAQNIGSISLWLHSGLLGNYLNIENIQGKVSIDHQDMTWHDYNGTPQVTITTCKPQIDLSQSDIFKGVTRVIFFGDSISDKGTLHEYTMGMVPESPPYYDGMFSNGDTWAVEFANDLNTLGIQASNYAVGGATALLDLGAGLPYTLDGEVESYHINSDTKWWSDQDQQLVFILIGANDYMTSSKNLSDGAIDNLTTNVVSAIRSNIQWLIGFGVKRFVIIGLPDLSKTPESEIDLHNTEVTHKLSMEHNQKLEAMVEQLQKAYKNNQIELKFINLADLFDRLIDQTKKVDLMYHLSIDPKDNQSSCWMGGYFITNFSDNNMIIRQFYNKASPSIINRLKQLPNNADIQNALLVAKSPKVCDDPENYIFWDRLHPTAQIHNALYAYIKNALGIGSN